MMAGGIQLKSREGSACAKSSHGTRGKENLECTIQRKKKRQRSIGAKPSKQKDTARQWQGGEKSKCGLRAKTMLVEARYAVRGKKKGVGGEGRTGNYAAALWSTPGTRCRLKQYAEFGVLAKNRATS